MAILSLCCCCIHLFIYFCWSFCVISLFLNLINFKVHSLCRHTFNNRYFLCKYFEQFMSTKSQFGSEISELCCGSTVMCTLVSNYLIWVWPTEKQKSNIEFGTAEVKNRICLGCTGTAFGKTANSLLGFVLPTSSYPAWSVADEAVQRKRSDYSTVVNPLHL